MLPGFYFSKKRHLTDISFLPHTVVLHLAVNSNEPFLNLWCELHFWISEPYNFIPPSNARIQTDLLR